MFRIPVAALCLVAGLTGCQSRPAPSAAGVDSLPAQWQAFGTEPFWGVRLQEGQLVWTDPEHPQGKVFVARRQALGKGARWSGLLDGKAAQIRLSVQPCSDGMSDTTYPITVRWEWAGQILSGCARPLQ